MIRFHLLFVKREIYFMSIINIYLVHISHTNQTLLQFTNIQCFQRLHSTNSLPARQLQFEQQLKHDVYAQC